MGALRLRPYQREAIDAVVDQWSRGYRRTAVVLPTGTGKTIVFSHLISENHAGRTVVLVHRDELARQAVDKLRSVLPGADIGVVKAVRNDIHSQIIVASVQTLAHGRRLNQFRDVDLVIVDEAHHSAANSYLRALHYFGCWSDTSTVGFTATMTRSDDKGLGEVWQSIAYQRDIAWFVERGYLAEPRGLQVLVKNFRLDRVARHHGDYSDDSLGRAIEGSSAGALTARAYIEHAGDRQGVVFAPTVSAAGMFYDAFNTAHIPTELITGSTPTEDRQLIYKRYRAGDIQVLANCMVLTEGWDMPQASCAVLARPTASKGLYVQMAGRVLRTWPGKTDALILDVVGVAAKMPLASFTDLLHDRPKTKDGKITLGASRGIIPSEGVEEGPPVDADLEAREVQLFARSHSAWLQTHGGIRFIPTKEWTYFLWPAGGDMWTVGRQPNRAGRAEKLYENLDLGYAMAYAEQEAAEFDSSVSQRSAPWRKRRQPPSDRQLDMLNRLGLSYSPDTTKAEASDLISIALASKALDRYVPKEER